MMKRHQFFTSESLFVMTLCLFGGVHLQHDHMNQEGPGNDEKPALSLDREHHAEGLWDEVLEKVEEVLAQQESIDKLVLQKFVQSQDSKDEYAIEDSSECILYFKIKAKTGTDYGTDQNPLWSGINPRITIELANNQQYTAEISGVKETGSLIVREIPMQSFLTFGRCITRADIKNVYLRPSVYGGTAWLVASIDVLIAKPDNVFTQLTSDPNLNKWVDYDGQDKYPYNARLVPLTIKSDSSISGECITFFKISAQTGSRNHAGFLPSNPNHRILLKLNDGQVVQASINGPAFANQPYTLELNLATDFHAPRTTCVKKLDIKEVSLVSGGIDGWYIEQIKTYVKTGTGSYEELTSDPKFKKWLYGRESYPYSPNKLDLSLVVASVATPQCGYGIPVCECPPTAKDCVFNLEVDELRTFTSYQKFPVEEGDGISVRGTQGVIYHIEEDGVPRPLEQYASRHCASEFNSVDCSEPQFVDGKTYRMAIAVNGQIPGPTLIVNLGQNVVIHVHNNLSSEGISIHWHGIHQRGTPWMDGVGQVTQCQIGPSSSYTYIYTAQPSGTFWYHSHSGAQRTDGFFGALIVKESEEHLQQVKKELLQHSVGEFQDLPDRHSITLLDWQHEASLDIFSQLNAGLGFHPGTPFGEIPPSDASSRYNSTRSYEEGEVGPVPYFSGLINGKGRHNDVPYVKTRLTTFPVVKGNRYRFRLIGAQGLYAYKFSIDGHKLTVVNTDGYWTEPVKLVDYIIIHTGERYDFILDANAAEKNYWIRAETLEIDRNSNGGKPPYKSLGHVAEAILQYTSDIDNPPVIPSTQYEFIKWNSEPPNCVSQGCKAVNCPFEKFHKSYNIECINVQNLRLLQPTPQNEMPEVYPPSDCINCTRFINFNFEGDSETSSVNGRNFILPPVPPQTQNDDFQKQSIQCDLNADCNPSTLDCMCTHIIDIPPDVTIQFVLTALGSYQNAHPIHLHGHTFHVVHVGYPTYDTTTGFVDPERHNPDIECESTCSKPDCDPKRCVNPGWTNNNRPSFSIDRQTVRKDTVIIPAGGYAVINFKSDNPGHWFLHCHIEVHQLEGMALIVNEAFVKQQEQLNVPDWLNTCGDVSLTVDEYKSFLQPATHKY